MRNFVKIFRSDDHIHLERDIQNYLDMIQYQSDFGGQSYPVRLVDIKYAMASIEKIDVVTYSAMLIFEEQSPNISEQHKRCRRKAKKAYRKIFKE